ncbi:MAG: diacylglycerol kinase family lipid kinase [Clostridiales bacterium]|nr:diacylglycerol kinase family lipid kinase [Clostridiales bacterium]
MLHFICNPISGNGKASKAADTIMTKLNDSDIPYEFHFSDEKGNATQIARELTEKGYKDIIVVGGDGTLHEVLNGLCDPKQVNLGLIASGSGNDLGSFVGIPKDPIAALDIILNGTPKPTDYLMCSGIRGINVLGTGVDVDILKRCYKSKILKGKFKYMISTLISVFLYKYPHATVTVDGKDTVHDCFIISCANGRRFGGGIVIAPEAVIDNGSIDFVLVNGMKWYHKPAALLKLATGKILDVKQTEFMHASTVRAVFDEPCDINIDGEIYSNVELDVSIVPGGLNMYRP